MKLRTFLLLSAPLLAALSTAVQAQVTETPATLGLTTGGNPQGYIQNANDQGVFFATSPGGAARLVPYTDIRGEGLDKLIRFEEHTEALGRPRALFAAGEYEEAAAAFGEVATNYAIILNAPQNFASEALFFQIESLRRAGLFSQMPRLVDSPAARTIATKLGERYQRTHEFQKLWSVYGGGDMGALKDALAPYEEPVVGEARLLRSPNFQKLPSRYLAQLAYLRGKVYESADEKPHALDDYYRAFTLANGNDDLLARLAMGAAMVLQHADPLLERENPVAVAQMQSVAYLYGLRFGADSMPEPIRRFAERPPMPRMEMPPVEAEEEGEAGAEGAGEEGAEGEDGEASADEEASG